MYKCKGKPLSNPSSQPSSPHILPFPKLFFFNNNKFDQISLVNSYPILEFFFSIIPSLLLQYYILFIKDVLPSSQIFFHNSMINPGYLINGEIHSIFPPILDSLSTFFFFYIVEHFRYRLGFSYQHFFVPLFFFY